MQSQIIKMGLAVLITAVIASGGTYYFLSAAKSASPNYSVISSDQKNTFTQSSKEYAVMGIQASSAFRCSSWASEIDDQKEAKRLFMFGYEQGKKFIGALSAQKIKQEDLESEVPLVILMLLQGPSEDFMLGKIYQTIQESALEDVLKTGDDLNSDEVQKVIAGNKFRDSNCQLIGK